MALKIDNTNKFNYNKFESDLLSVLKEDETHKLDFDGKLLIKSSRFNCCIAAKDVHWDESVGDIVLVGAFRSGEPQMDTSKGYPVMRQEISVPLRECFEDLKRTSGLEMALVGKAKKAVIDKYMSTPMRFIEGMPFFADSNLDLPSLGMGKFKLKDMDVLNVSKDDTGRFKFVCSNTLSEFEVSLDNVGLKDIRGFGKQLEAIVNSVQEAKEVYLSTFRRLEPNNTTRSDDDRLDHCKQALLSVYDAGFPIAVCDCVARRMCDLDLFDTRKYKVSTIRKKMDELRGKCEDRKKSTFVSL